MRIYRIEYTTKTYRHRPLHCRGFGAYPYIYAKDLPSPRNDGIDEFKAGVHRCATISKDQLAEWFDFTQEPAFPCVILEIEAEEVLVGNHQVVFNPDTARVVREVPREEMLTLYI